MPHYRKKAGFVHRITVDVPVAEFTRLKKLASHQQKSISDVAYEQLGPWLATLSEQEPPPDAA